MINCLLLNQIKLCHNDLHSAAFQLLKKQGFIIIKMIKNISLSIALIIISYGCDMNNDDEYKPDIKIEIEHNLPEINGYPTLTINDGVWQNIHMIDFRVLLDGNPSSYSSFQFESNLFWFMGDTSSYGKKSCLDCEMELIGDHRENLHDPVPTSNYSSLTDSDGYTRNAIAPVKIMKGDTLKLWWDVWVTGSMEGREGTITILLN
tara:strand:- start:611 stop:1225 length:615 start_codon:yes stop_codon:yes gene_type:complete